MTFFDQLFTLGFQVAGQSPEAAELNPSGVTQVDVDAEIRLEAENGPPSGDGCHDLEESPLEDVNADSPWRRIEDGCQGGGDPQEIVRDWKLEVSIRCLGVYCVVF